VNEQSQKMEITVNGEKHQVTADPEQSLLTVLRDHLGLTGAKYGCGEAQCGACTVLLDGKAARSCVTPLSSVKARAVTTVEGLEKDGKLHPVQEAFLAEDAMQCGYCITGMIMTGVSLMNRNPKPTESEIRRTFEGNVCRCGSHPRILAALRRAAASGEAGEAAKEGAE